MDSKCTAQARDTIGKVSVFTGTRDEGFYWVKDDLNGWRIALWYDDGYNFWQHPDKCSDAKDSDFTEIDERRITRPE